MVFSQPRLGKDPHATRQNTGRVTNLTTRLKRRPGPVPQPGLREDCGWSKSPATSNSIFTKGHFVVILDVFGGHFLDVLHEYGCELPVGDYHQPKSRIDTWLRVRQSRYRDCFKYWLKTLKSRLASDVFSRHKNLDKNKHAGLAIKVDGLLRSQGITVKNPFLDNIIKISLV